MAKLSKVLVFLAIMIVTFLSGCGMNYVWFYTPPLTPSAWTPSLPSETGTSTPIPTLTPIFTAVPSPTNTSVPTFTATPSNPIRNTPLTLMLHPSSPTFDSVAFLQGFITVLKDNHFTVITYQDISRDPDITATEKGKLAIITIDDVYLQGELNPSVGQMISVLLEAGYPAVIGVVTQGKMPNPEVAETLKNVSEKGWEIATHTDTHADLGDLEEKSLDKVYQEINISQDKIENVVGIRPTTLFLPDGQMVYDDTPIKKAGIVWMVGIGGGETYDVREDVFYVGRAGAVGLPEATFKIMMRRFNP